jgi:cobalt-zinc-cadmium efflux system membrane fusion protein
VPADAVTRLDGRDIVFVRAKEGFVARPVVVGGTVDGQTTIVEGLAAGAVVATSNLPELKSQAAR